MIRSDALSTASFTVGAVAERPSTPRPDSLVWGRLGDAIARKRIRRGSHRQFAPHLAEELWEKLGEEGFVLNAPWPDYDQALAATDLVLIAIQVNGRTRAQIQLPRGATEDQALRAALARYAGSRTSARKASSSRLNGKRGGRPRVREVSQQT